MTVSEVDSRVRTPLPSVCFRIWPFSRPEPTIQAKLVVVWPEAVVTVLPDHRIQVTFVQPQRAVTAGQAVVLYQGEVVVGGGTIESAL